MQRFQRCALLLAALLRSMRVIAISINPAATIANASVSIYWVGPGCFGYELGARTGLR